MITTDRLLIRYPILDDAAAVNAAIRESMGNLRKYMPWANCVPNIDETAENIKYAIKLIELREDFRLLIFSHDNELIGSSGIHKVDWKVGKAEIGYWIRSSKSGNGYMTEAVRAITDYAMNGLGLKRIEIIVSGSNSKSRKIPERLDYEMEGILRNHRINNDGSIDDTVYYAKIRQHCPTSRCTGAADAAQ